MNNYSHLDPLGKFWIHLGPIWAMYFFFLVFEFFKIIFLSRSDFFSKLDEIFYIFGFLVKKN